MSAHFFVSVCFFFCFFGDRLLIDVDFSEYFVFLFFYLVTMHGLEFLHQLIM